MPLGAAAEERTSFCAGLQRVLPRPEVFRMFTIVRHDRPRMGIVLKETYKDKRVIQDFIERVRGVIEEVPGVRDAFVRQAPLIRRGGFTAGSSCVRSLGRRAARGRQFGGT